MSDPRFPGWRSKPFYNPNEQELADLRADLAEALHLLRHAMAPQDDAREWEWLRAELMEKHKKQEKP